jgi:hypothetical protein
VAELKVKGHAFYPGIEVAITGERGKFRFQYPTWNEAGKLILTFIGGAPGHECWRSFYAERVRKVYK